MLEDRLVLTRLNGRYGSSRAFSGRLRDLSQRLKLPLKMVSSSLPRLVKSGFVRAIPIEGKIGRPSYRYELGDSVTTACTRAKKKDPQHRSVIEFLALNAMPSQASEKAGALSPVNAFLLAFLIYSGGASGVICKVPKEDYLNCLGIKGNRLDSQIKKLERLGYIKGARPGAYSKRFLGVVPATIFLELKKCYAFAGVNFFLKEEKYFFGRDKSVADMVFEEARHCLGVRWDESENWHIFRPPVSRVRLDGKEAGLFSDRNQLEVRSAFQTLLDVCACDMILQREYKGSGSWDGFDYFSNRYKAWFTPRISGRGNKLGSINQPVLDAIYNYVSEVMRQVRVLLDKNKDKVKGDLVGLAVAPRRSSQGTDLVLLAYRKQADPYSA